MILSIAYYLILEEDSPLFRFGRWFRLNRHPYGEDIASQRSIELFASYTEEQKQAFFRLQGRRRVKDEHWAYDSTSISSHSESVLLLMAKTAMDKKAFARKAPKLAFDKSLFPEGGHDPLLENQQDLF